jgi:pimeloyl-ACP methyl ester carboxylesterase
LKKEEIERITMKMISSKDGVPIAVYRSGEGPPLILVHGGTADHNRWISVLPMLEESFTVYAIDRRGHGKSGEVGNYSIEHEYHDIALVADSIREPVNLLGHSYGAICTLEAALLSGDIRRMVLYEPPIPAGIEVHPPGIIDRIKEMVEAGDRDGALTAFASEVFMRSPQLVRQFRSAPQWQAQKAMVHTLPREMRAIESYRFHAERFKRFMTPTLLLLGEKSPRFLVKATQLVGKAVENSRVVVMPGQEHMAMDTAPELFVNEVVGFLKEC